MKRRLIVGGAVLLLALHLVVLVISNPPLPATPYSIALSGDGKILAIGSRFGQVVVHDIAEQKNCVNRFGETSSDIITLALSYRGDRIALSTFRATQTRELDDLRFGKVLYENTAYSSELRFCDRQSHYLLVRPEDDEQTAIVTLARSRKGGGEYVLPTLEFVDIESENGTTIRKLKLKVPVDLENGTTIRKLKVPAEVEADAWVLAYGTDATFERVVCAFSDGHIVVWKKMTWEPEIAIKRDWQADTVAFYEHSESILVNAACELALVDPERHAIVWRVKAGACLVATDATGRLAATVGSNWDEVVLWAIEEDQCKEVGRISLSDIPELQGLTTWKQFFR